jgi:hypothetical protein
MSDEPVYREELPEECPPADAIEIQDGTVLFRLVRSNPPTNVDFDSWRALNPEKPCPNGLCECRARAVSVHDDAEASAKLRKLPKFRRYMIAKLSLEEGAGKIKETGGKAHYAWWPFADFNIVAVCEMAL